MSRFERLIENAQTKKSITENTPTVTTSGRFGSAKVSITSKGPYTQSTYQCIRVTCEKESCDAPILHVVEPEYDLEVGLQSSIPIELIFTEIEGKVREGTIKLWSRHALATNKTYVFDCPECGNENKYVICKDDGLLIMTVSQSHHDVPIPKDRIRFISSPKSSWPLQDA